MNRWLALCLIIMSVYAEAATVGKSLSEATRICSDSWERFIEQSVPTGDGRGHGPDVGSDEWKSVVEFRLSIRDRPDVPERDSEAWCRYIDQIVRKNKAASGGTGGSGHVGEKAGPSFACDKVREGSIEAMICTDGELSALDLKLSRVVTFFRTDPATLIAERGDSISLMYLQATASGTRYEGRNHSFREHHGEASVTWGFGAPEMNCKKTP